MTIQEIEAAVIQLPDKVFWQLMESLDEIKNERWDQEIARDAEAGRFDTIIARGKQNVAEGRGRLL